MQDVTDDLHRLRGMVLKLVEAFYEEHGVTPRLEVEVRERVGMFPSPIGITASIEWIQRGA